MTLAEELANAKLGGAKGAPPPPPQKEEPEDLLSQIRGGFKLKKATDR